MDEKIMDEKILSEALLIRENFNEMLMNDHEVQMGRDKFKIKNIQGEWCLVKITPAGHEYPSSFMSVKTFLYYLSNTDKT